MYTASDWILFVAVFLAINDLPLIIFEYYNATFTRHRTNFRPAQNFDQIFRSRGTVRKFRSVKVELIMIKFVTCVGGFTTYSCAERF